MLPYTSKFYCNGTIFDSTGQPSETYVSVFAKDRDIYFLRNVDGLVEKYNIDSEQIETLSASTPASTIEVNSIIVDDMGVARCFSGHAAKIHNATDECRNQKSNKQPNPNLHSFTYQIVKV